MESYEVFAFQSTKIIDFGDNVADIFLDSLLENEFELEDGDVIAITSKVISMQENAAVKIDTITPSDKAHELGEKASMDPKVAQIVIDESEEIFGSVFHAILTKTKYGLSANAGIDLSNTPKGHALLLPRDPDSDARTIRKKIEKITGKKIAVIIIDSKTIPLRMGTSAVTIGLSGIQPLIDERGKPDLYGYKMTITTRAIADNIATAANIMMGETTERRPFAIVRGVKFDFNENSTVKDALMPEDQCLYFAPLLKLIERSHQHED